jgi:membrane protease YdiL (CAAX protease family)
MIKTSGKILLGVLGRLSLTFAWLIPLSIIIDELNSLPAILSGIALTIGFFFIHGYLKKPNGWTYDRTKWVFPDKWYFLISVAILLVLGDVFWLFHIKTSKSPIEEDPIAFVILGIAAFPLIEEFGFRLWIQSFLETKLNPAVAILIVALIFAFFHKPEMPIPQLLGGIFYGSVLVVTKSIWWVAFLHMVQNAILILAGRVEFIKELSFTMMDRADNLNIIVAIALWIFASFCILIWIRWNMESMKTKH